MLLAVNAKRSTLTSSASSGKRIRIRQVRLDQFALLQIVAGNDEVGGVHVSIPGCSAAVIFAFADDRFATGNIV